MLIDFSVENFRSFGEEQTLNLVASRSLKEHANHCVQIPNTGESVLRTSLVYGANAAGKSNLVKAIDFAKELILSGAGPSKQIALDPFRFAGSAGRPSSFEFRFLVDDRVYVYGFDVTTVAVVEEWLAATTSPKGKQEDIYYRKGQEISLGRLEKFGESSTVSTKALKALKQLGTRPNQLLLNKVVDLEPERQGDLLERVVHWFSKCLTVIRPDTAFVPMIDYLEERHAFRRFVSEFLLSMGTGIESLRVDQHELTVEELPAPIVEHLRAEDSLERAPFFFGPGFTLEFKPDDATTVIRRNVAAVHEVNGAEYALPFSDESDGTQRFVNLLPALYHDGKGCHVYVIDELDRSLHPLLSYALLEFAANACARQQLIATTHETHLLDLELLRRDEVWFAEKDERQQTQLTSLVNMKVRKDLRIEKSYLQGRFGAIPFIGGGERLMGQVSCAVDK